MRDWRVAESLQVLLKQVNELAPNRDKSSDGSIGNSEHSARTSDHNPDDDGVVKARDITNDPAHGVDSQKMAQQIVDSRDSRVKYIISNRRIISGDAGPKPWLWRSYDGPNPHNHHFHISVKKTKAFYDSPGLWKVSLTGAADAPAPVPLLKLLHPTLRMGDSGKAVELLQGLLNKKAKSALKIDGQFGSGTKSAIVAFQKSSGIVADGVVGKYTWEALYG